MTSSCVLMRSILGSISRSAAHLGRAARGYYIIKETITKGEAGRWRAQVAKEDYSKGELFNGANGTLRGQRFQARSESWASPVERKIGQVPTPGTRLLHWLPLSLSLCLLFFPVPPQHMTHACCAVLDLPPSLQVLGEHSLLVCSDGSENEPRPYGTLHSD